MVDNNASTPPANSYLRSKHPQYPSQEALYEAQEWGTKPDGTVQNAFAQDVAAALQRAGLSYYHKTREVQPERTANPAKDAPAYELADVIYGEHTIRAASGLLPYTPVHNGFHPAFY